MVKIGGNITAEVQIKTVEKNRIGEGIPTWETVGTVIGWLDYASGEAGVSQYRAKIQDTTHMFLCDYKQWLRVSGKVTGENSRLVVHGDCYNILHIDNPMELNEHMEIYLQYIGGGVDV